MPLHKDGSAPYAPVATLIELLERYRDRGLQTPFTGEVLVRAGVAESLASRTLQALRLLDLIDEEGKPTEQFVDWAQAPHDEAKALFAAVLRSVYADVFSFADPSTDPPERVRDAFRAYRPRGQQERMVILFLGLCAYAGITPEVPRRQPSARTAPPGKPRVPARSATTSKRRASSGARGTATTTGELPPALSGLLAELPATGGSWTKQRRDEFLRTFAVVLDFTYPVVDTLENHAATETLE